MRKNIEVKKLKPLTLNKETLRNLELPKNAVLGQARPQTDAYTECSFVC